MSNDVSAFGVRIQLVASVTFPAGVTLSQFADDADPFDVPSIQIGDSAMGVNGDLVTWSKASALKVTVNTIPGSDDDANLGILYNANRVAAGKFSSQDVITMTILYPDGTTATFSDGVITDGMPAKSVASAGRLKSKPYMFHFQDFSQN